MENMKIYHISTVEEKYNRLLLSLWSRTREHIETKIFALELFEGVRCLNISEIVHFFVDTDRLSPF